MMSHTHSLHLRFKLLGLVAALLFATAAQGEHNKNFEVIITNITKNQTFTPQLVATHDRSVELFSPGEPASLTLEILAEAGDTAPLMAGLQARHVSSVQTARQPLGPGESVSVIVEASLFDRRLSVAAMLIPTNDTFRALARALAAVRRGDLRGAGL